MGALLARPATISGRRGVLKALESGKISADRVSAHYGIRQTFHDLEVDRFFEITEGADRPEALRRQRIVLGGDAR
jgi:hypothetical protein